jgi:uncharacterized damage-inducible protein DinB
MSECSRLADQIRRAFEGEAWHGDSVLEILADVDARTAAAHPVKGAHSIWELVLHIAAWDEVTVRRAEGNTVIVWDEVTSRRTERNTIIFTDKENFPPVTDTSEAAWRETVERVKATHTRLVMTVAAFPDSRLMEQVPGKTQDYYNFFYLFSGIVQHELYHAGQIALLKKFR